MLDCTAAMSSDIQGCGVASNRRFLGGVGVGLFNPIPEVCLNHFLHRIPKLQVLNRTVARKFSIGSLRFCWGALRMYGGA